MKNKSMTWAEFIASATDAATDAATVPTVKFVPDAAPAAPRTRRDTEKTIRRAFAAAVERHEEVASSAIAELYKTAERIQVSVQDALDAGCCRRGTARWLRENRWLLCTKRGTTTAERLLVAARDFDEYGQIIFKEPRVLDVIEAACRRAGAAGKKLMSLLPYALNQDVVRDPSTKIAVPICDADREAAITKLTKFAGLVLAPRWSSDWAAAAIREVSRARGHMFYPGCCRDNVKALMACRAEWVEDEWSGYYWAVKETEAVYVSGSGRTKAVVSNNGVEVSRIIDDKDEIRIRISAGAPKSLINAALHGTAGQGDPSWYNYTAGVPADIHELAQWADMSVEEVTQWVTFIYDVEVPDDENEIGWVEAIGPHRPSHIRLH